MKGTIKTIKPKTVQTKFGTKEMFTITFHEEPNKYIDCFLGKWNDAYKLGHEIEYVLETEKDKFPNLPSLKMHHYTKKDGTQGTGYNLYAPLNSHVIDGGVSTDAFNAIVRQIELIWKEIKGLKGEVVDEPEEKSIDVKELGW